MGFSEIKKETIPENITIHFLHIEEIDEEIEQIIQNSIVRICEGRDSMTNVNIVKQGLIERLKNKRGTTLELGLISEFFIHLYLNYIGLNQECLYDNLEDSNGIKKGFDGLYSDNNHEIWLVESKSGKIMTQNISHKNKIDEAYKDLSDKISGNSSGNTHINPRQNAAHHAKIADTNESLYKQIQRYNNQFREGYYDTIDNFNIIPASTIFFDGKSITVENIENFDTVKQEIINRLNDKHIKKGHILCFSQKTKNLLINYLERE